MNALPLMKWHASSCLASSKAMAAVMSFGRETACWHVAGTRKNASTDRKNRKRHQRILHLARTSGEREIASAQIGEWVMDCPAGNLIRWPMSGLLLSIEVFRISVNFWLKSAVLKMRKKHEPCCTPICTLLCPAGHLSMADSRRIREGIEADFLTTHLVGNTGEKTRQPKKQKRTATISSCYCTASAKNMQLWIRHSLPF